MNGFKFALPLLALVLAPCCLWGQAIPITLIADTNTPDPSGSGGFTGFGIPSSDRDELSYPGPTDYDPYNNIFFTAQGANGVSGVYVAAFPAPGITEISTIADTTMAAATGGNFASFSNTSSGEDEAGFIATDSNGAQSIYAFDGYGLHFIASNSTNPVPETTFGNFQSISFISEGPPFYDAMGEIESASGIYDFAGGFVPSFTLVANTSTIPSGSTTPFTSFGPVSYRAGDPAYNIPGDSSPERAVLATVNNVQGIYYFFGFDGSVSPYSKLVNTNSVVPGGTSHFTSFGNPIATASYIEFTASYANGSQQGIFVYGPYLFDGNVQDADDPSLQEWLASGMLAPGSGGAHFASFLALGDNQVGYAGNATLPHNENEVIPFLATLDNGQTGLYCTDGIDNSVKVLETGDLLDGKIVSDIELSPDSSGLAFTAFGVDFTDGSSGIFYFDTNVVPEPALLSLLGIPMLLAFRRYR